MAAKSDNPAKEPKAEKASKRPVLSSLVAKIISTIATLSLAAMLASIFPLAFIDLRETLFPVAGYLFYCFVVCSLAAVILQGAKSSPVPSETMADVDLSEITTRLKNVEMRYGVVFMEEFNSLKTANASMRDELQVIEKQREQLREDELDRLRERNAELEKLISELNSRERGIHAVERGIVISDETDEIDVAVPRSSTA